MKPVPHGEPYAGKLHVRFDEGAGVPDNKGRPALLYTPLYYDKTRKINRTDLRALKANGCRSVLPILYLRYPFKVWGYVFKKGNS